MFTRFMLVAIAVLLGSCTGEEPPARKKPRRKQSAGQQHQQYPLCTRVVDGDTVVVGGEKVRLVGVDTPGTVHPRKPVQYFGKEASAFTKRMLEGKRVRLEYDSQSQAQSGNRDRYGRLLAYVYLAGDSGPSINKRIILEGYGHAYTKYPFDRMQEFRRAEREARENGRGLWAPRGSPRPPPTEYPRSSDSKRLIQQDIVYHTRTGKKYHRFGCRHLQSSTYPIGRSEAKKRFTPCSVCKP